ncbi:ABC transporter ATP-binding protein [Marisediminicola senii]|uniref:ABC transporter ATP-binding protein n=1 Tax=Marisediminicola senii TaxID=2711233 RepID=UPI001F2FB0E0|nr:ABC transporter ATP-binding protein [Marisediminicola senii]
MNAAGLAAGFTVDRGTFRLDLELAVPPGGVTAIVGPNGAGKSTALRTIAGLVRPSTGRVSLAGRVLDDAASMTHLPPAARGIGVVFQDYLLFPHLTAAENVAFGLLAQGMPRRDAHRTAREWLDRFGLSAHADSRPGALSGGQAQRVALARALVLEPALLLLDEPLAALDAATRLDVRADLVERLREFGGATVLVTHDPLDAVVLADEIVVLEHGRVAQRGAPTEVTRSPANDYVARLVGLHLLRLAPTTEGAGRGGDGAVGGGSGERTVVVSPSEVRVSVERPADAASITGESGSATWECRVTGVEELGGRTRILLESIADGHRFSAELALRDVPPFGYGVGSTVWATLPIAAHR